VSGLLVITAHPDDEVLIAGGTLAALSDAGEDTGVVCLTRGELGPIADPQLATPATLGAVRGGELRAACAELGVGFVRCYRRPDGNLRFADRGAITAQLTRLLDARRPDAVITFGEDGLYYHPDHIAVHEFVARAVAQLAAPPVVYRSVWPKHLMAELGAELRARNLGGDLWGFAPEDFGTADLNGAFALDVRRLAARKLRALLAHRTQIAADNALGMLEPAMVERFLGTEWFAAVGGSRRDWLRSRLA
jgi:LmbE family N-acetylglucosaminyl deacetylase